MSDRTKIQWADATWNPMTGCTKVSEACQNCYALRMLGRNLPSHSGPEPTFHPDRLDVPLHWRKPRRVFVCSMSDLFHEAFTDEQIDDVFAIVDRCPQHTFLVLTKRPERMRDHLLDWLKPQPNEPGAFVFTNLWLGVTVENAANRWRLEVLKDTPASVRFVSYEPALGPFGDVPAWLDWFICGPETGPGRRYFSDSWAIKARHQCKRLGIPYFDKRDEYADWREVPS